MTRHVSQCTSLLVQSRYKNTTTASKHKANQLASQFQSYITASIDQHRNIPSLVSLLPSPFAAKSGSIRPFEETCRSGVSAPTSYFTAYAHSQYHNTDTIEVKTSSIQLPATLPTAPSPGLPPSPSSLTPTASAQKGHKVHTAANSPAPLVLHKAGKQDTLLVLVFLVRDRRVVGMVVRRGSRWRAVGILVGWAGGGRSPLGSRQRSRGGRRGWTFCLVGCGVVG